METFVPHTNETMNTIKNGKVKGGSRVAIIADTLNNQFLGTGYGYTALSNEEKKRKNKKSIEKEYEYKGIERDETEEIKRFRIFLESHKKYDPRQCPNQGTKLAEMSLRIGRACKGAIEYTVNKGNEVHFILDGIDFDYVKDDLKMPKAERNITSKEIKWIYRNRNNKQVMENVNFYKDNKITKAPWDEDRAFWDIYDSYRKKKQKNKKNRNLKI